MPERKVKRSSGSIDYEDRLWGERGSIESRDLALIRIEFAEQDIRFKDGSNVLEVGCGTGDLLRTMLHHQRSECAAYGIDINLASLRWSSDVANNKQIGAIQGDILELPVIGETFDVILGFDIFEHLPNMDTALAQVYRCLKSGGRFHCFIPCDINYWSLYRFLWKYVNFNLKETYGGHIQKLTSEDVLNSIHSHGFIILKRDSATIYSDRSRMCWIIYGDTCRLKLSHSLTTAQIQGKKKNCSTGSDSSSTIPSRKYFGWPYCPGP
jgi:SAM-dependent methyltransferase